MEAATLDTGATSGAGRSNQAVAVRLKRAKEIRIVCGAPTDWGRHTSWTMILCVREEDPPHKAQRSEGDMRISPKVTRVCISCMLFAGFAGCQKSTDAPADASASQVAGGQSQLPPDSPPRSDRWLYEEPIDKVTGNKLADAKRTISLDNGGTAELTADCRDLNLPLFGVVSFVGFAIVFFDRDGTAIDVDTKEFNQFNEDNDTGLLRYSISAGTEAGLDVLVVHSNEVQVRLFNPDNSDADTSARSFVNAKFAKIEIPLLDGDKPVFDLLPQDQGVRKVVKYCFPSAFEQEAAPAASSSGG